MALVSAHVRSAVLSPPPSQQLISSSVSVPPVPGSHTKIQIELQTPLPAAREIRSDLTFS